MAKELKGGLGVEEVDGQAAGEASAAPAQEDGLTEDILYATPEAAGNGAPAGKKPDEKPDGKAKPKAEEEVDDEDDEDDEGEEAEGKDKP